MPPSEIFFPRTRKYGDVMYMAPVRDSEEADIFTESVRESLSIIEKMMRKGSTGKSGAEDVKGAMISSSRHMWPLPTPTGKRWWTTKGMPSTRPPMTMWTWVSPTRAMVDEPREKAASTLKRASPTPERPGKEIKRHEKPTAWQKGTGKASDADDENVTGTESETTGRAFRRLPGKVRPHGADICENGTTTSLGDTMSMVEIRRLPRTWSLPRRSLVSICEIKGNTLHTLRIDSIGSCKSRKRS